MASLKCSNCGEGVTRDMEYCPSCGEPIGGDDTPESTTTQEEKTQENEETGDDRDVPWETYGEVNEESDESSLSTLIVVVVAVVVMVVAYFTGWPGLMISELLGETPTETSLNDEAPPGGEVEFGQSAQLPNGVEVSISDLRTEQSYSSGNGMIEPDRGNVFVLVNVTARNTVNEERYLPDNYEFPLIIGDRQYEPSTAIFLSNRYEGDEVQPGITREGRVLYEVPQNSDFSLSQIVYSEGDTRVVWG